MEGCDDLDSFFESLVKIAVPVIIVVLFVKLMCDMRSNKLSRKKNRRMMYEKFEAAGPEQQQRVDGMEYPSREPNPPGGGDLPVDSNNSESDVPMMNEDSEPMASQKMNLARQSNSDESQGVSKERILGINGFGVGGEVSYTACDNHQGPLLDTPLVPDDAVVDVRTRKINYSLVSPNNDCTSLNYQPCGIGPNGPGVVDCPVVKDPYKIMPPVTEQIDVLSKRPSGVALREMGSDSSQVEEVPSEKKANVTMHWANWCGYSQKAAKDWDPSLVGESDKPGLKQSLDGEKVNGISVTTDSKHFDTKESKDEKIQAFPTFVVKVYDSKGNLLGRETFNSIDENDMNKKIRAILQKH